MPSKNKQDPITSVLGSKLPMQTDDMPKRVEQKTEMPNTGVIDKQPDVRNTQEKQLYII